MRKLIILIIFILYSNAYDLKKVDFATFCQYVSYHIDKNIVLSEEVPTNFSVFMPDDNMTKKEMQRVFFSVLRSKHLNYKITRNTILVYKKTPIPLPTHVLTFEFTPKSVITSFLKSNYPNVRFYIFQNKLLLTCSYSDFNSIKLLIHQLESSYRQAQVSFLISVIDNKKAKELSNKLNLSLPFANAHYLLNIVTDTATVTTSNVLNFSTFINFLNSKGVAQTISKPSIRLIDSKNYTLESVHNIPYVEKTVTVDKDGNPITQTSIKYKDVGLKIYIKNVYITPKNIDFDMDIYIQNIVSYQNNIPIVDTKHFNTHVQLTKNSSSYLIAGLRSVTKITNKTKVPVLSDIPFLGLLFRSEKKSIEDLSFTFYITTNYFKTAKLPTAEERP
ncbi:type II secretion system protein GspD [Caminibacter sp.]